MLINYKQLLEMDDVCMCMFILQIHQYFSPKIGEKYEKFLKYF